MLDRRGSQDLLKWEEAVNEVTQSKRREVEGKQYRRHSLTRAEDFKCESARKPEPHI
jgi:hypothetical protein